MKRKHRYASLAPILFLLLALLLWLHKEWPQGERLNDQSSASSGISLQENTQVAEKPLESSQRNQSPHSSKPTPLWKISSTAEGSANGLRLAFAAASRGKNELPEGRRWKIETFPDLRRLKEGERLTVVLPDDQALPATVVWSRKDHGFKDRHMVVLLFDEKRGSFTAVDDRENQKKMGRVFVDDHDRAWTFDAAEKEDIWLREHWRSDLICDLPSPASAMRENPLPGDPSPPPVIPPNPVPAPLLNSRVDATAALYIDFDGQAPAFYPDWFSRVGILPYTVNHSGLTQVEMETVWRRVAEDFIQFNINVTTDAAKYANAPVGRRMRVFVASSVPDSMEGGGIAQLSSFRLFYSASSDIPCWVAVNRVVQGPTTAGKLALLANVVSHELGHTLGLWHDGNNGVQPADYTDGNYYKGHGTPPNDWAPIMGESYRNDTLESRNMVQWARNSYTGANNAQDDLAVIASPANGFGYAADESTGLGDAQPLEPIGIVWLGATGIIKNSSDQDWWRFTIDYAGDALIEMAPAESGNSLPNLDCGFYIADSNGVPVTGMISPQDDVAATEPLLLFPGTYYVVASGTGNRSFADDTGYDNYGSAGRYVITIIPPPEDVGPELAITSPANNSLVTGALQFQGTVFDLSGIERMELRLRRESDGAYWNGSYWDTANAGYFLPYSLSITSTGWTCTAPMPQSGSLGTLTPGTYSFLALAYDYLGNFSSASAITTLDATGPQVAILAPMSGSLLGTPGLNFFGTATENGTLQYVVGYIRRNSDGHYWNGSNWQSGSSGASLSCNVVQRPSPTIYDWTCTATLPSLGSTLTPGSYTFIAIAVDGVGLTQQRDAVINVDSIAPVTTLTAPAHNSIITSSSVPFNGTITDNAGVWRVVCFIRRHTDSLYWNGSAWIVDPGAANLSASYNAGNNSWTCTATLPQPGSTLANGGYNFIALGFDHAGNVHQVDSVVTVDFHQTYVWNGSGGSDWDIATSWTPNGIPGADDYVLINNGGTVNNHAIRMVYGFRAVNGTITSSAGNSLTFTNDSRWTGGTITGVWNNANGGTIVLNQLPAQTLQSGAVLQNAGLVRNDAGNSTISNAVQQLSGGRILNNGSNIYLSGGGEHQTGSVLEANTGAIYLNGGTHTFSGGGFAGNNWTYCSAGTMLVQGDVGPSTGAASGKFGIAGGTVTGSGTVSARDGYFSTGSVSGSVVLRFTNTFTKPTNTTLNMNGGTLQSDGLFESPGGADFNLDSASGGGAGTIVNKGTWRTSNAFTYSNGSGGGIFRNEGLFESLAGISMIAAAYQSEAGSTFRSKSGYVRLGGGGIHKADSTFDADGGDIYFSAGTHQLLGGTFIGPRYVYATGATVSIDGNVGATSGAATGGFGIAAGTITGTSMLSVERGILQTGTISGTATLRLTGQSSKPSNSTLDMNGGTIRNEGTLTASSGGNINLDSAVGGGAGLIINTGTWRTNDAFTYSNGSGGGVFRNEGLFESLAGISMIAAAYQSEAGSTFRAKSGYVRLGGGGIHQPGSTFDADGGDIYFSAGTHQLRGGTLIGSSFLYATGGTTSVDGNVGVSSGAATGGFAIAGGTVTGTAMLSAERGSLREGTVAGTVTIRLTGASNKVTNSVLSMNGGTIRNEGTMSQPQSADINLDSSSSAGAGTLVNTGIWNTTGSSDITNGSNAGMIENHGLWHISAGNSTNSAYFTHHPASIFRVTGGQMIFLGGGNMKPGSTIDTSGGALYLNGGTQTLEGGTITGASTVYCGLGTSVVTGDVGATSGAATGGFGIYNTGRVTGTGMLSVDHGYLAAGSMAGTVTLRFTGTSQKITSTVLNMNGGIIRNEGIMNQPNSGDFNLDSDVSAGAGMIVNTGTWNTTGSSNITNGSNAGVIENHGLWHISAGNSTNSAYFTHHPASIFRVTGGQMIFLGGGNMKPNSIIDTSGGHLYLNGGTQTLEGGTITGASTVYCGAGTSVVTGDVGATSGAATGGFGIYNTGRVTGTGMLSVDHGYLAAGSMAGTVTLRFTGNSQKITSTVLNMNGGTIRNEGIMNQSNSGDFNLDSDVSAGAGTIVNTGTWNTTGSSNITNGSNAGVIENHGLWHISAGNSTNSAYFTHHSDSIFRLTGGQMIFVGGSRMKAGATLDANGGYLYLSTGTHTLEGGTITGNTFVYTSNGTTTVTGDVGNTTGAATGGYGITAGTLNGTAVLSAERGILGNGGISGTVTLRLTGNSQKITSTVLNMNGGTIRNEGTMTVPGSGNFELDSLSGGGAGAIINTGMWNQTGGSNFTNNFGGGMIENYGVWLVSAGNSTNSAYFTNHSESIFRLTGGQMIFVGGSRMKAGTTLDANGGYLYLSTGTHTLEGGTITGSTLVYTSNGTTTITGDVGNTTGAATGGYGITAGTLNGTAVLSAERGILGNGGIGGTVTLRLTGNSQKITSTVLNMNGGTIRNEGTMTVSGNGDFELDSLSGGGAGAIINTGTWINTGTCDFTNTHLNGILQNSGTFEIIAGTTNVYSHYTNSGLTRVAGGALLLRAGSVHTGGLVSNGGITFIGSGHSLSGPNAFLGGTGSFSGSVSLTNAARISPGNSPGTLSLSGNVQFLASTEAPAIAIEIDSATLFDRINLGSSTTLALGTGVTDLSLNLNYQPVPGQTFRIITAGASTGTFSGRFRNAPATGNLVSVTYGGNLHQFRVNYDTSSKFIDLVYQSGYQLWTSQMGLIGTAGDFDADPDGDGISNGIEFIIGGDPRPGFPDTTPHPNQNNPVLDETHLIFTHRRTHVSRYLPTVVQYNSDLAPAWNNSQQGLNGVIITVTENFYGAGIDKVETKIPRIVAVDGRIFVRLYSRE